MLFACSELAKDAAPANSTKSKVTKRSLRTSCTTCVTSYSEATETFNFGNLIVTVSYDGTNLTYNISKYYAAGGNYAQQYSIGNIFFDGIDVNGTLPAFNNGNNTYTIVVPQSPTAACTVVTHKIRATGNNLQANTTYNINYSMPIICAPQCTNYNYDTAFGGSRIGQNEGPGKGGWWYFYTAGDGTQPIYAGQTNNAGTVSIDGAGNYTISLANGFELKTGELESVKIQSYATLPSSRPPAGQFTSYKGTSLSGNVGVANFYIIHLDVQKCAN